ncbi:MAG: hypothetical protein EOP56_13870 [Sphingobacteriales bacterium]|nr:MAG: hypothetical protein EOP56_13870 [Sphingobacteriales bacterium]
MATREMPLKLKAKYFYITILVVLTITTLIALYDGGYGIEGGTIAIIALLSIITSLLPYYLSMQLLNKHARGQYRNASYKYWAVIVYILCFPLMLWIIYLNIDLLLNGGNGWSFG